ncbi:MAG: serine/threonine protein kinase [Polyangiaceae bacterium]|nr:serine/threonine protein kinase [Polyangiaceae bacterium]
MKSSKLVVGPGRLIAGRYELVALLGRGGMGEVWRARHLALDAEVAVKLMLDEARGSPEALGRFVREAQAAARLRSPHVVQILDHGSDGEMGFIAMELLDGESLGGHLARVGRLEPALAYRILAHVARALGRAHEEHIVHRDLKPENVFLVDNDGELVAKVLDFGIAKHGRASLEGPSGGVATAVGALLGTPFYMSPEQLMSSTDVDFRTDLWAMGVIAYECLLGHRPFQAPTIGQLVTAVCHAAPPVPSERGEVPGGFDAWFARATARDPFDRFPSAHAAAEALAPALGVAAMPLARRLELGGEAGTLAPTADASLETAAFLAQQTPALRGARASAARAPLGEAATLPHPASVPPAASDGAPAEPAGERRQESMTPGVSAVTAAPRAAAAPTPAPREARRSRLVGALGLGLGACVVGGAIAIAVAASGGAGDRAAAGSASAGTASASAPPAGPCDATFACPAPDQQICSLGSNACETSPFGVASTDVTFDGGEAKHYAVARSFSVDYTEQPGQRSRIDVTMDSGAVVMSLFLPMSPKVGKVKLVEGNGSHADWPERAALSFAAGAFRPSSWSGAALGTYAVAFGSLELTKVDYRFGGSLEGTLDAWLQGGRGRTPIEIHLVTRFRASIP